MAITFALLFHYIWSVAYLKQKNQEFISKLLW